MRGLAPRQVEQHLVNITPAPSLGRVVTFDDRMARGMKMLGRVLVRGIVATTDMAARATNPQMQPFTAALQAFLATQRARRDVADAGDVSAALCHGRLRRPWC